MEEIKEGRQEKKKGSELKLQRAEPCHNTPLTATTCIYIYGEFTGGTGVM